MPNRTDDNGEAEGAHGHPIFGVAKLKRKQREKRVSQQKLLKGCHQDKNVTVLVFTVLF